MDVVVTAAAVAAALVVVKGSNTAKESDVWEEVLPDDDCRRLPL